MVAAALAFAGGIVAGAVHRPAEQQAAERYARAWAKGDWGAMHAMLTSDARERTGLADFRRAHERAAATATATRLRAGEASKPSDDVVRVPVRISTRVFGTVRTELELPLTEEEGEARVPWRAHLAFPGVRAGEELARRTRLPPRATLTASDGTVLARGEDRNSPDPELAGSIRGELGPWREIAPGTERRFDAVLINERGMPHHIGIVERPGFMLHMLSRSSVIESYAAARWERLIAGFFRHEALT